MSLKSDLSIMSTENEAKLKEIEKLEHHLGIAKIMSHNLENENSNITEQVFFFVHFFFNGEFLILAFSLCVYV